MVGICVMPDLITLANAKSLLRVDFPDDDLMIAQIVSAASEAVLDYLKSQGYSTFFDGTALTADVPMKVQLATGHLVQSYYDGYLSEGGKMFDDHGDLPKPVVSLLYRMRDPALS